MSDPVGTPVPPPANHGSAVLGFVLAFVLHAIQFPLIILAELFISAVAPMSGGMATISLVAIGLTQLVYQIPAIFILRGRGQTETAKGVIIGAAVTAILNAACWGLIIVAFRQTGFGM